VIGRREFDQGMRSKSVEKQYRLKILSGCELSLAPEAKDGSYSGSVEKRGLGRTIKEDSGG